MSVSIDTGIGVGVDQAPPFSVFWVSLPFSASALGLHAAGRRGNPTKVFEQEANREKDKNARGGTGGPRARRTRYTH